MAGNARYVSEKCEHLGHDAARRAEVAKGQHPIAAVVTCSDSRVPPELFFDQGLGDIFVVRNAGNVADDHVLGSLEYAVEHLHVPLILVVGHAKCGAVAAAVAGGEAPGHIHQVVESIAPVVPEAKSKPGDPVENAVEANARRVADQISSSAPILGETVHAGKLKVVAARYDLATGKVSLLP